LNFLRATVVEKVPKKRMKDMSARSGTYLQEPPTRRPPSRTHSFFPSWLQSRPVRLNYNSRRRNTQNPPEDSLPVLRGVPPSGVSSTHQQSHVLVSERR